MASSKVSAKRGRLSRNVLGSGFLHEEAAWDFLAVVRDLFPERFAELKALESITDRDERAKRAREWVVQNHISCSAVDEVAALIASGQDEPFESFSISVYADKNGQLIERPPPIGASPQDETLDEFVHRAKQYYHEVREWFEQRGVKKRPTKHGLDPFRYLAAHLIGGYSLATIARGETRFQLPIKSDKTIAGEARKAAHLVGISLPNTPGPRRGSKLPRRRRRPRRP